MHLSVNMILKAHPFENTLGPGPYQLVDFFVLQLPSESNQGRNNFNLAPQVERGIGSCAHCGTGIINIFIIQCSDGKRYGVGSDCILKVGLPSKELSKLERIERERQRVLRLARKKRKGDAARIELQSLIDAYSDALKMILVNPGFSQNDFLSYAQWSVKNSNDGGIVFALKRIKNALKLEKDS